MSYGDSIFVIGDQNLIGLHSVTSKIVEYFWPMLLIFLKLWSQIQPVLGIGLVRLFDYIGEEFLFAVRPLLSVLIQFLRIA